MVCWSRVESLELFSSSDGDVGLRGVGFRVLGFRVWGFKV